MKKYLSIVLSLILVVASVFPFGTTTGLTVDASICTPTGAPVIRDLTLYAYCENDAYADNQGYNWVSFNVNNIEDVTVYDQNYAANQLYAACLVGDTIYGFTHVGNFIAIDPTDFSYEVIQSGLTYATTICDMVYDHTTDTVYAIHVVGIPGTYEATTYLSIVDLTYGTLINIGVCNNINLFDVGGLGMFTLSVDSEGTMFAISKDGHLYEIDKETGHTTDKFDLGITLFAVQSATIDLETNTMYWYHYNSLTENGLYAVNPYSGEKTYLGQIRNGGQYYGLIIMQDIPQPGEYDMGDVNMDGSITAMDALLVLRHSMELSELSPEAQELADITGDGSINAMDALNILRVSMG
ncbi:MAG: dockerin type I repeat-containing protein [Clostridia bacterium]|nr:dockerin type I repeat-containing protein [Clostridia bacterium]